MANAEIENSGKVVQIIGPVVDVEFSDNYLPPIYQALRIVSEGFDVEDKIDVKPKEMTREDYTEEHARMERDRAKEHKESVGSSIDDAWIHSKIVAKLIGNTDVSEHKINVDVNNNVVTLRGTVESAMEKAEAERVAKDTDGVKRVVNQLKVAAAK